MTPRSTGIACAEHQARRWTAKRKIRALLRDLRPDELIRLEEALRLGGWGRSGDQPGGPED